MQDMLAKIIEMDENARKIKEKAEQEKISSEVQIEELRQQIYDDYIARAKDRVEKNAATDRALADSRLKAYSDRVDHVRQEMQETYRLHHDEWIDTIVERVLAQ